MSTQAEPRSTNRWIKIGVWGLIVVVLAFLGWGLSKRSESRPTSGPAPDFTLRLFEGYEGEFSDGEVTLSDLRGRVVVINFWASWCVACREEADLLEQVWRDYQDQGVVLIGVAYDDTEAVARQYLRQYDITYPNGLDGRGRISGSAYHVTGAPETFVVDQRGEIVYVKIGPFVEGELEAVLDDLVSGS